MKGSGNEVNVMGERSNERFVVAFYEEGRFDAAKARRAFRVRTQADAPFGRAAAKAVARIAAVVLPLAAAIVAGVVIYGNWRNAWTQYGPADGKSVVAMADGTSVTLAPGAVLKVRRRVNPRSVYLDGRAYFEVARDERHPFEIRFGKAERFGDEEDALRLSANGFDMVESGYVKVLGTRFSVDAAAGTVAVSEGKVFFASGPDADGVVLTKGMSATLFGGDPVLAGAPALNADAWVTGRFVYEDVPLRDVLKEIGDYFGVTLSVGDASTGTASAAAAAAEPLRLTGKFSTDSLGDIVAAIEAALDVTIACDGPVDQVLR